MGLRTGKKQKHSSRSTWEGTAQKVRPPYVKEWQAGRYPEYRGTRGTLREAGWTTIQGRIRTDDR